MSRYRTPRGVQPISADRVMRHWMRNLNICCWPTVEGRWHYSAAAEDNRSENTDYIYRKKQLREIDRRIRYTEDWAIIADCRHRPKNPYPASEQTPEERFRRIFDKFPFFYLLSIFLICAQGIAFTLVFLNSTQCVAHDFTYRAGKPITITFLCINWILN